MKEIALEIPPLFFPFKNSIQNGGFSSQSCQFSTKTTLNIGDFCCYLTPFPGNLPPPLLGKPIANLIQWDFQGSPRMGALMYRYYSLIPPNSHFRIPKKRYGSSLYGKLTIIRWWQLKYFGEMIQFDEHIFQLG